MSLARALVVCGLVMAGATALALYAPKAGPFEGRAAEIPPDDQPVRMARPVAPIAARASGYYAIQEAKRAEAKPASEGVTMEMLLNALDEADQRRLNP